MATFLKNNNLFCDKCGEKFIIKYPIEIKKIVKKAKSFEALHESCNIDKDLINKANEWLKIGEANSSSITMWNCLMLKPKFYLISYPKDPDDFSKCYKLLEAIPEWKAKLYYLKRISPVWWRLVDNWDKLTEMHENKDKDMYNFMKKIINND
jgi:hypothetical protein